MIWYQVSITIVEFHCSVTTDHYTTRGIPQYATNLQRIIIAKAIPRSLASSGTFPGNKRNLILIPATKYRPTRSNVDCSESKKAEYPAFPAFGVSTIEC